ncbi:MAG TPA: response regulator [Bryobacteraceae bacterium]
MLENPSFIREQEGKTVILVVDDEPFVRNIVQMSLTDAGYHVLTASDGVEALLVSRAYSGAIDLVLSDVIMPNMPGTELAERIVQERPGVGVLLMTGKTSTGIPPDLLPSLLRKPFRPQQLLERIRQALGGEH